MTRAPRVGRNLVWLALGDAVSRGGVFLYALLVARSLGPQGFGVFSLAQSTALYVWIAVDLGVNLYGAREVARAGDQWRTVVRELLGLRIAASACMAVVYVTGSWLLAPEGTFGALALSGAYLVANALSLDWAAKGMECFHLPALGNTLSATLVLVGYVVLVRPEPDPAVAAGVWGVAYLGGALLLHLTVGRGRGGGLRPSFDITAWRGHLSASLWFAASGALLSAMQYAPVLALTLRGSFDDLGRFSAAARVVTVSMSAGFLLPMAVYPSLSRQAAADAGELSAAARRLQGIMLGVGLVAGAALFLAAAPVIHLLYGDLYEGAVPLLRVLAGIVPLVFVRYSVGSVLLAAGHQARHSMASSVGLVATAAGCLLAAPTLGPAGAAWAWLVGEAVVAVLMAWVWIQEGTRDRA